MLISKHNYPNSEIADFREIFKDHKIKHKDLKSFLESSRKYVDEIFEMYSFFLKAEQQQWIHRLSQAGVYSPAFLFEFYVLLLLWGSYTIIFYWSFWKRWPGKYYLFWPRSPGFGSFKWPNHFGICFFSHNLIYWLNQNHYTFHHTSLNHLFYEI